MLFFSIIARLISRRLSMREHNTPPIRSTKLSITQLATTMAAIIAPVSKLRPSVSSLCGGNAGEGSGGE